MKKGKPLPMTIDLDVYVKQLGRMAVEHEDENVRAACVEALIELLMKYASRLDERCVGVGVSKSDGS